MTRCGMTWVQVRVTVIVILTIGGMLALTGCAPRKATRRFEFTQIAMGVPARVVLEASDEPAARAAAMEAYRRIEEIEQAASDYRPRSAASLLTGASDGGWREIPDDLAMLLRSSREVSARTGGAFAATQGRLTRLWRASRREGRLPREEARVEALSVSVPDAVEVDVVRARARVKVPGVALDFGGIAKGYAAEQAVGRLASLGFPRAMVAIAGDISVGDPPTGEPGWRVRLSGGEREGYRDGDANGAGGDGGRLWLSGVSVSTSGDREQGVEIDGARYSHIVDPRTGVGIVGGPEVTVIGSRGTQNGVVDAVATAGVVLWSWGEIEMLRRVAEETGVTLIVRAPAGETVMIGDTTRLRWVKALGEKP